MAYQDTSEITITPLLCIGGQSTRMGHSKHLLPLPSGLLTFEGALNTIHGGVPTADTIYISLRDQSQLQGIRFRLEPSAAPPPPPKPKVIRIPVPPDDSADEHDRHSHHESMSFPKLAPILDTTEYGDIGPAAGLLAAHAAFPDKTFLVLGCDYPFLPPSALQQLVLEYEPPFTSFVNEGGFAEPLIAIWGPEALRLLKERVKDGKSGLDGVGKDLGERGWGKLVIPLREEWIRGG